MNFALKNNIVNLNDLFLSGFGIVKARGDQDYEIFITDFAFAINEPGDIFMTKESSLKCVFQESFLIGIF